MPKTQSNPKKSTPNKKHPGGRPTKFNDKIKTKAQKLSTRGFTDREISEILEINISTITRWKKKHPEFCTSLNDWKANSDESVERSLFERACGYSFPVETTEKEIDGKKQVVRITKHIPPDPTSMIFWLKNRRRDKWRDRQDITHDGTLTLEDKLRQMRDNTDV